MDNTPSEGETEKDYATRRVSLEDSESPESTSSSEQEISTSFTNAEEALMDEVVEMEALTETPTEFLAVTKAIETDVPHASPTLESVEESKSTTIAAAGEGKRKNKNQSVVIAVVIAICVVLLACICACTTISIVFVTNVPW